MIENTDKQANKLNKHTGITYIYVRSSLFILSTFTHASKNGTNLLNFSQSIVYYMDNLNHPKYSLVCSVNCRFYTHTHIYIYIYTCS